MYRLKICSSFIMLYFLVLIIVAVECKERNGQAIYQTGENWTKKKTIQIVDGYITGGMRLPCELKFISLPVEVKLTVDIFEDEEELKKCENLIIESKAPEEATIILSSGVFAFPSKMMLKEMDLRSSNKTIIQVTEFEKKYKFGNIQLEGNIRFENPEMLTVDELYAHTDGHDLTTIVSFMAIVVKNSVNFFDLSDDYKEVPVAILCDNKNYPFFLRKCMFGKDSQVTCEENGQNIRDVTDLAYRKLANMEIYDADGTKERECEAQESEACFRKDGVTGDLCNKCKNLFYTFNSDPALGCADSGCDKNGGLSYDNVKRKCQCKDGVTGDLCDKCKNLFYTFNSDPDLGCTDSGCDKNGGLLYDNVKRKCQCKSNVNGQTCSKCMPGFYGFANSTEGCLPCDCLGDCAEITGECRAEVSTPVASTSPLWSILLIILIIPVPVIAGIVLNKNYQANKKTSETEQLLNVLD